MDFGTREKIIAGIMIAAVVGMIGMSFMGGSGDKQIKSNVGDRQTQGDNLELSGVNIGGGFSMDKSVKSSTVTNNAGGVTTDKDVQPDKEVVLELETTH